MKHSKIPDLHKLLYLLCQKAWGKPRNETTNVHESFLNIPFPLTPDESMEGRYEQLWVLYTKLTPQPVGCMLYTSCMTKPGKLSQNPCLL